MNPDLLAMVYVERGEGSFVGTGYPLDGEHILTSRHVLYGQSNTLPARVEILLYGEREAKNWRAADVAWDSGRVGEADAAILHLAEPISPPPNVDILPTLADWGSPWTSAGFARLGETAGGTKASRDFVPVKGDFHSAASHPQRAQLVPEHVKGDSHDWQGMSGAPLFSKEGKLIGLIHSVPADPTDHRWFGTSLAALIRMPDFAKRFPDVFGSRGRAREYLARVLSDSPELCRCIREAYYDPAVTGSKTGAELAKVLLGFPLKDSCQSLHRALRGNDVNASVRRDLREALGGVLWHHADAFAGQEENAVAVPALVVHVAADARRADADGAPPKLIDRGGVRGSRVTSYYCLEVPPEIGMKGKSDLLRHLHSEILQRFDWLPRHPVGAPEVALAVVLRMFEAEWNLVETARVQGLTEEYPPRRPFIILPAEGPEARTYEEIRSDPQYAGLCILGVEEPADGQMDWPLIAGCIQGIVEDADQGGPEPLSGQDPTVVEASTTPEQPEPGNEDMTG